MKCNSITSVRLLTADDSSFLGCDTVQLDGQPTPKHPCLPVELLHITSHHVTYDCYFHKQYCETLNLVLSSLLTERYDFIIWVLTSCSG